MKVTLTPVIVAAVCIVAGCTSTGKTAATAHPAAAPVHPKPAPMLSPLTRAFGAVLTLPVMKSSPVGKGIAWSAGSYKKADSSVTVDWYDTPSAECGRAREVRLDETSKSVIIQLVPGKRTVPVCSADERSFTMIVPLSAPIGSRAILQQ
jgi:hypothetical protein